MNFKRYHVSKNLFSSIWEQGNINTTSGQNVVDDTRVRTKDYIPIKPNIVYSFSRNTTGYMYLRLYRADKSYINAGSVSTIRLISGLSVASPMDINETFCCFEVIDSEVAYIRFIDRTNNTATKWQMVEGEYTEQTMPEYEPYSSEVWHDIPHYIMGTSTDTLTTLPADIYVNDTTATVGLKGNMEQSGTPTPQNPIQPQECGDLTGNLLNAAEYFSPSKWTQKTNYFINCKMSAADAEKFKDVLTARGYLQGISQSLVFGFLDADQNSLPDANRILNNGALRNVSYDFSNSSDIYIYIGHTSGIQTGFPEIADTFNNYNIMINTGSNPLPYEPYGVKIPILNNSQTTNVYLKTTQTIRQIKKLVLTGEENWVMSVLEGHNGFLTYAPQTQTGAINCICSHYKVLYSNTNNAIYFINNPINGRFVIFDDRYSSTDDFKAYLAQQYATGTPVTVWYVLAEPTTGILNEPLRKIGDYADTVSGITIPTIAGANTLLVDTTLQPSEVTATYKGWHPVSDVHEKSRNLSPPLTDWISGYVNNSGSITRADETNKEKTSDYIKISAGESYTFSRTQSFPQGSNGAWRAIGWYNQNKNFISRTAYASEEALSASAPSNAVFCRLSFRTYGETINTMFNTGSSALPYEPYWT